MNDQNKNIIQPPATSPPSGIATMFAEPPETPLGQDALVPNSVTTVSQAPPGQPIQPPLGEEKKLHRMPKMPGWAWRWAAITIIILGGASFFILRQPNASNPSVNNQSTNGNSSASLGDESAQSVTFNIDTKIANGKTLTATGPVIIQNEVDSLNAFRIQNAAGSNLLVADTKDQKLAIATDLNPTGAALQVGGDISASGTISSKGTLLTAGGLSANNGATSLSNVGLTINSVLICTAYGCNADTLGGHPSSYYTNASNLAGGTLTDAILPVNVALLDANQTFTKDNTFNGNNVYNGTNTFNSQSNFNGVTIQNGNFLFQSATNSVGAFQIQNAAGNDNLLIADTTNTRIGIGTQPNYTLDVNGDINVSSGHTFRIGGQNICQSGLCTPSGGSGFYINNTTTQQTGANFNIQSAGYTDVGGVIQGASGQTADLFEGKTSGGTIVYALDPQGNVNITGNYEINGAPLCSAGGCTAASGSGSYIQNGIALQANANFNIESAATGDVGGIIRGISGQTADLLQLKDGNGNAVMTVGANGAVLAKDTSSGGNHSFFQIQGSNFASNLLTADTVTGQILLPNANISSTALLLAGNANLYAPSNNNLKTDNNLIIQGSVMSGGYSSVTGGIAAFNGNVGIGTTNPQSNLNVVGSTSPGIELATTSGASGASSSYIGIATSSNAWANGAVSGDTVLGAKSGGNLILATSTSGNGQTAQLRINPSGQIGIGATPANGLLTVGTNTTTASGGIYFGTDTDLYRSASGKLATDGSFVVNASNTSTAIGIGVAAGNTIGLVRNAGNLTLYATDGVTQAINFGVNGTPTIQANTSGSPLSVQANGAGALNLNTTQTGAVNVGNSTGGAIISGPATLNGTVLAQNSTNSSSAFSVKNSSGTSVLGVDTTNLGVNVTNLQASGTISLQGPDGGSILLRTAANSGTGTNAMTFSGNEITDATRSADIQGDGETPPQSSTGIWESTTNLVTNGGFESGTSGYNNDGGTISQTTTTSRFGSAAGMIVDSGSAANQGADIPVSVTSGQTYTFSVWVKAPGGASMALWTNDPTTYSYFTGTGSWQRVTMTITATTTNSAAGFGIYTSNVASPQAITYYIDGVQVENKAHATPYVETNGATATRNAAHVQAPGAVLGSTTGWAAFRVDPRWASSAAPNSAPMLLNATNGSSFIQVFFLQSNQQWCVERYDGSTTKEACTTTAPSFLAGSTQTVAAYWTGSNIAVSIDGSNFAGIPATNTVTPSAIDLGSVGTTYEFDGDILWTAAGTGTLSNADAASLYNYGNSDPSITTLNSMDTSATPTFAWDGEGPQYSGTNNSYTNDSQIAIDDVNLTHTGNGSLSLQSSANSTTALNVQNASGSSIFDVDTSNGRVGIGTTSSQDALQIGPTGNSTTHYQLGLASEDSATSLPQIILNDNGSNWNAIGYDNSAGAFVVGTTSSINSTSFSKENLVVAQNGDTSVAGALTVGGFTLQATPTSYGTIGLSTANNGYYGIVMGTGTSNANIMFDASGNGGLYYQNSGLWGLFYNRSTDHLSVNTSSDLGYTLNVSGTADISSNLVVGGYIYNHGSYMVGSTQLSNMIVEYGYATTGTTNGGSGYYVDVTFPSAFPNGCVAVVPQFYGGAPTASMGTTNITSTGFRLLSTQPSDGGYWIALGY